MSVYLSLLAGLLPLTFGVVSLACAIQDYRRARRDAEYRASVMVAEETRKLRAGQARAAARDWGMAA